jgi:hypothetical protein
VVFALLALREAASALISDAFCAHTPVAPCLPLVLEQRQVLVAVIESRAVVVLILILSSSSMVPPFSFDKDALAVLELIDAANTRNTEVFRAAVTIVAV